MIRNPRRSRSVTLLAPWLSRHAAGHPTLCPHCVPKSRPRGPRRGGTGGRLQRLGCLCRPVQSGKVALAYPSVLARFAVAQTRDGRKVGGHLNCKDVSSALLPAAEGRRRRATGQVRQGRRPVDRSRGRGSPYARRRTGGVPVRLPRLAGHCRIAIDGLPRPCPSATRPATLPSGSMCPQAGSRSCDRNCTARGTGSTAIRHPTKQAVKAA